MSVEEINLEHRLGRPVTDEDINASLTCSSRNCSKKLLKKCSFICKEYDPVQTEGVICQDPLYNEREFPKIPS